MRPARASRRLLRQPIVRRRPCRGSSLIGPPGPVNVTPLKGSRGSSLNQSCRTSGEDSRTASAAGAERISLRCADNSAEEKQTAATTSQHRVARLIFVVTNSPGAVRLQRWAWRLRTPGRRTSRCAVREHEEAHGRGLRARLMSRSTSSRLCRELRHTRSGCRRAGTASLGPRGHVTTRPPAAPGRAQLYQFSTRANTSGATIVASDSMMNFGVLTASLPQVIFSLGSAPEYEP